METTRLVPPFETHRHALLLRVRSYCVHWRSRFRAPHHEPHPEERTQCASRRMGTSTLPAPTLRDASLRDAPQGEVIPGLSALPAGQSRPHAEERAAPVSKHGDDETGPTLRDASLRDAPQGEVIPGLPALPAGQSRRSMNTACSPTRLASSGGIWMGRLLLSSTMARSMRTPMSRQRARKSSMLQRWMLGVSYHL